jgi:hypothetical protein
MRGTRYKQPLLLMKNRYLGMVLGFGFILAGCIPSLQPLYTEKDLIFDPSLVGAWSDSKETWLYEKDGEKAYRLTYTDADGKKGEFQAHLLKLGDWKFLDLYPDEAGLKSDNRNDFYNFHYVPVHTFFKISQISPVLQMSVLKGEWLEELLKADPKAIRHEEVKDRVVLTASTKELQAFVLQHARTEAAWGDPSDLRRVEAKPNPQPAAPPASGPR